MDPDLEEISGTERVIKRVRETEVALIDRVEDALHSNMYKKRKRGIIKFADEFVD